MDSIFGYIPAAIVLAPFVTAVVRQSLYYKGCMDGMEFVMAAFFGFAVGGALNLAFLGCTLVLRPKRQVRERAGWTIASRGGLWAAWLTLLFQVGVVLWFMLHRMSL